MKKRAHRRLQESLLLYIDGELSREAVEDIEQHLSGCPECRRLVDVFDGVWKPSGPEERPAPPPSLWPGLLRRIEGFENGTAAVPPLGFSPRRFGFLTAAVLGVFLSMAAGIYLGQLSEVSAGAAPRADNAASADMREWGFDQFQVLLPGTLYEVFLDPEKSNVPRQERGEVR